MHKSLIGISVAASIFGGSMPADARQIQEALFIIDMSTSAAPAVDAFAAKSAGNYIEKFIKSMKPGDRVKVHTLGRAGIVSQQIYINVILGKKSGTRPRRVASALAKLIRSLPQLVKNKKIKLQPSTNIIGFVETLAPSLDCENKVTTIVIFSDGIEWSEQVNGNDLLAGKIDLPPASGSILRGCHVEIRGLGEQNSNLGTNNAWFVLLRKQWTAFFKSAGVASFKAYAQFE